MKREVSHGLWACEMELDEVPETPVSLRTVCLQDEAGETREHYELGFLEIDTEEATLFCQVIPILVSEEKVLVAVPAPAWSRTTSGRYLPKGSLSRAVLLGFLSPELEGSFQLEKQRSLGRRRSRTIKERRRCLSPRLCFQPPWTTLCS